MLGLDASSRAPSQDYGESLASFNSAI